MADFTVLQQTVNGLGTNGAELKVLIQNKSIQPSVIILQETKLSKRRDYKISGYNILRKDRFTEIKKSPQGGLIIAIKHGIDYKPLDINIEGIEINGVTVNINGNKPTNVINVYLHTSSTLNQSKFNTASVLILGKVG